MTCHSRWMSAGLGLYVRTVVAFFVRWARPRCSRPGVVLRLLTNTARRPVWCPVRVCTGSQLTGVTTRQESRPARIRRGVARASKRDRVGAVTAHGHRLAGRTGPHDDQPPLTHLLHRSRRDRRTGALRTTQPPSPSATTGPAQEYDVPITDGTIRAADLGQIRVDEDEPGLAVYDPGFVNTASCRSAVTFIDGEKGILEYRGYPIEQLAEKSTFLEVAYLLIHGELPTKARVRRLGARDHLPHVRARERQDLHARASATTRTRWAC